MKRSRRRQLVRRAYRECAEIIEAAINADLGIFSEVATSEEEGALIETTMRHVSDRLYERSEAP